MSFIRAYLRASTKEQNAERAKESLIQFATDHGQKIASFHMENESGRKLHRPELMRLIEDANKGDIILIESVDRLSRLTPDDWEELKRIITDKGLTIVAMDLPTSHIAFSDKAGDDLTTSIMKAVNGMLIDILAAMACKDYELRRERSAQGVITAREKGAYKGRPVNTERNNGIAKMLDSGMSYSEIRAATGASRTTIAKVKRCMIED